MRVNTWSATDTQTNDTATASSPDLTAYPELRHRLRLVVASVGDGGEAALTVESGDVTLIEAQVVGGGPLVIPCDIQGEAGEAITATLSAAGQDIDGSLSISGHLEQ